MQPRILLPLALACVLLAGGLAPAADSAGTRHADAVARYERFAPDDRRDWLHWLLADRMDSAMRVYLHAEDLATQQRFIVGVLERADAGRKLSDAGLLKLLDSVAEHERAAVDYLARDYRIAVYQAFRTDRTEFDRRLAAWGLVYRAWQDGGERDDERPKLIRWLQGAISRMQAGQVAKLPALPKFGEPPAIPVTRDLIALPPRPEIAHHPTPTPSARAAKSHVVRKPATALPRRPSFEPIRPLWVPALANGTTMPKTSDAGFPGVAAVARAPRFGSVSVPGVSPHQVVPRVVEDLAALPQLPPTAQTPSDEVAPTVPIASLPVATPNPPAALTQAAPPVTPPQVAMTEPAVAARAVSASEVLRAEASGVRIDTTELAARIAGYNLALSSLVERLQDDNIWTAAQLLAAVDDLSDLNRRGSDLRLYCLLVPQIDRQAAGDLAEPDTVVALLGAKIFASRNRLVEGVYDGSVEQQQAELAELDKLSQRLARLGGGK